MGWLARRVAGKRDEFKARRRRAAQELLRRRIAWRHQGLDRLVVDRVIEQTCNAKVDQFGTAFGGHEHVDGLEVAMHHQIAVGVGHCVADAEKQGQTPI